jgi:hypothetical protein
MGEQEVIFIEIVCPLSAQRSPICSLSPEENAASHHFLALCSEIGILTYRAFEVRVKSREVRREKEGNLRFGSLCFSKKKSVFCQGSGLTSVFYSNLNFFRDTRMGLA